MKAKVTIAMELKNKGEEELQRKDYREATKLFHKALLYIKGKLCLKFEHIADLQLANYDIVNSKAYFGDQLFDGSFSTLITVKYLRLLNSYAQQNDISKTMGHPKASTILF